MVEAAEVAEAVHKPPRALRDCMCTARRVFECTAHLIHSCPSQFEWLLPPLAHERATRREHRLVADLSDPATFTARDERANSRTHPMSAGHSSLWLDGTLLSIENRCSCQSANSLSRLLRLLHVYLPSHENTTTLPSTEVHTDTDTDTDTDTQDESARAPTHTTLRRWCSAIETVSDLSAGASGEKHYAGSVGKLNVGTQAK